MRFNTIRALWKGQRYHLDKMSFRDLVLAYLFYPAVRAYILVLLASAALLILLRPDAFSVSVAIGASFLIYPLVWYLLHRYVLHGHLLYRSSFTAALWKRIHYDHHQDPNDLRVLFGALYTTLPTIAIVTFPIGYALAGYPGAMSAFAAGIVSTLFYEFLHCIQHLRYVPRNRTLRRLKRLHMMHHFHNESGNFGITNFFWDKVLGTYYEQASEKPASETVFNLGYSDQEQSRYPWVARLSESHNHQFRQSASTP